MSADIPFFLKIFNSPSPGQFFGPKKCPFIINVRPINVRSLYPKYTVNEENPPDISIFSDTQRCTKTQVTRENPGIPAHSWVQFLDAGIAGIAVSTQEFLYIPYPFPKNPEIPELLLHEPRNSGIHRVPKMVTQDHLSAILNLERQGSKDRVRKYSEVVWKRSKRRREWGDGQTKNQAEALHGGLWTHQALGLTRWPPWRQATWTTWHPGKSSGAHFS